MSGSSDLSPRTITRCNNGITSELRPVVNVSLSDTESVEMESVELSGIKCTLLIPDIVANIATIVSTLIDFVYGLICSTTRGIMVARGVDVLPVRGRSSKLLMSELISWQEDEATLVTVLLLLSIVAIGDDVASDVGLLHVQFATQLQLPPKLRAQPLSRHLATCEPSHRVFAAVGESDGNDASTDVSTLSEVGMTLVRGLSFMRSIAAKCSLGSACVGFTAVGL